MLSLSFPIQSESATHLPCKCGHFCGQYSHWNKNQDDNVTFQGSLDDNELKEVVVHIWPSRTISSYSEALASYLISFLEVALGHFQQCAY
jgi:hypothetical protein